MKPTREQVIAWAREAGLHIATDHDWMPIIALAYLKNVTALAYEAGRKDENEECATMCEVKFDFCGDELIVAEAIRARRAP